MNKMYKLKLKVKSSPCGPTSPVLPCRPCGPLSPLFEKRNVLRECLYATVWTEMNEMYLI